MAILPIFYKSNNKSRIVLVGGGEDACRKTRLFLNLKMNVTVICDDFNDELKIYIKNGAVLAKNKIVEQSDIIGACLVFGASDDGVLNAQVSQWARQNNIPVNVVDKPDLSDFIMGGIVNRSPVIVSICSNGYAPILVRNTRILIETLLDKNLGKLASFAQKFRETIARKFNDQKSRRRFWESFFSSAIPKDFLEGNKYEAWKSTLSLLNRNTIFNQDTIATKEQPIYTIVLDNNNSDSLTLGDIRHLQLSDIIIYDDGLNPQIFNYFRRDAIRYNSNIVEKYALKYNEKICYIGCKPIAKIKIIK